MAIYALSMAAGVYYHTHAGNYTKWLAMPGLLAAILLFDQSLYTRREFGSYAWMVRLSLCLDYHRLLWDSFWLIGAAARLMMILFAVQLYVKMKDPIFSPNRAPRDQRPPK